MNTNANSPALAAHLAATRKGASFTGLIVTKKGQERGKGADKKVYGNDTVHVCVVTGFSYLNLCKRSLDKLGTIDLDALVAEAAAKGVVDGKTGAALTRADFDTAMAEVAESLAKSIAGTNESTTDDVFEPLVLNGETVKGARVYCGPAPAANDERAPVPGTVYLQGLQIGSRVLEPAPNGPVPASVSVAKTLAKGMIEKRLPKSRYVSYVLDPKAGFLLRAGGAAVDAANLDKVPVDLDDNLFA